MSKLEKHATETLVVDLAKEPFLFEDLERLVNQSDSPDNGEVTVTSDGGIITVTITF